MYKFENFSIDCKECYGPNIFSALREKLNIKSSDITRKIHDEKQNINEKRDLLQDKK